MSDLPSVVIYTDGACDPNPGLGGWAAILKFHGGERVLTGSEPKTTNNRMELTAAIQALQSLKQPCEVDLFTDSVYVKLGVTEWLPQWRSKNWRRKGGKLANIDLWQALDTSIHGHQIRWHWVRGHAGDCHNQRVDYLARKEICKTKK